jgi:hypothetical protein
MRLPSFRPREISQAIQSKLKPDMRAGKEIQAYYVLDGKRLFRVTLLKEHSASSIRPGTLNQIIKSLHLSRPQFADLVNCPMTGSDYETIIRQKLDAGTLGAPGRAS